MNIYRDWAFKAPKRPQATPLLRTMYTNGVTYIFAGSRLAKKVENGQQEYWHVPVLKLDRNIKFD